MQHPGPYLVNCSILFQELPLLERPAAAKAAGFDAIELWWPFPSTSPGDAEVDRLVAAVEDAGVRLIGLNLAAGDMPAGDRGLVSWPGRAGELLDSVAVAVDIGRRLGVRAFNALYGNRVDGASPQEQDELAADNLALAAQAAEQIGAVVLVEPVSGAPRYPLRTADDVVAVLDRVEAAQAAQPGADPLRPGTGPGELRLLADLYHLAVNGDDVAAVIARHADRIGHVQVADAPGRHEPGTGTLELDRQLDALSAAGYAGWIGLEYLPTADTPASFDWLPRERRAAPLPTP